MEKVAVKEQGIAGIHLNVEIRETNEDCGQRVPCRRRADLLSARGRFFREYYLSLSPGRQPFSRVAGSTETNALQRSGARTPF